MLLSPPSSSHSVSLTAIETAVALIAIALPFAFPRLGFNWFSNIERSLGRFARRKALAVITVGLAALLLRLALLPAIPIPLPFIHDDFSFLLAADTYAHGRLTNPTPAMWVHFESFHIDMKPTYMSMYFPAKGLVLAASQVLFGHPWFGLLIANALMCAAICWMLQAWLPPAWALLGGMWAVLHLALFSYWINTYTGAGSLAALGGALLLGGLPRFVRTARVRDAVFMAFGAILLSNTRPFEGMLVCVVVAIFLVRWLLFGKRRPPMRSLMLRSAPAIAILVLAVVGMGYYNYRVFGKPTTLPYTINRATYGVAPYFLWQTPNAIPAYRNEQMRRLYAIYELNYFNEVRSRPLFYALRRSFTLARFFAGLAMFPIFLTLWHVVHDRRPRILVVLLFISIAAFATQAFVEPHYLGPFLAGLFAIGLQCARHLRQWKPGGKPVGLTTVRMAVCATLALCCLRLVADPLHLTLADRGNVTWDWLGGLNYGEARAAVERTLEGAPGKQLALVRYAHSHDPYDEWVYNAADIDSAKVIWARDLGNERNREILTYYRNRMAWLVQPDLDPPGPYPITKETLSVFQNSSK